ncbi:MAG: hypothetical protein V9E83_05400 [Baekduia sp.]
MPSRIGSGSSIAVSADCASERGIGTSPSMIAPCATISERLSLIAVDQAAIEHLERERRHLGAAPARHGQQRHQRTGALIEQGDATGVGMQQLQHQRAAAVQGILDIVAHQDFTGQIAQGAVGVDAAPIDRRRSVDSSRSFIGSPVWA